MELAIWEMGVVSEKDDYDFNIHEFGRLVFETPLRLAYMAVATI